ncbi:hypothetical protein LTS10_001154 [Elasticomyces elasticus]|nr:hypothetical protein LTS10_001154 [Elasticomyces elasticus]
MASPTNGNEYKSFTDLIALERLNANSYRSIALAFGPAEGTRTYGGHVYMQACYAASKTLPKGFTLHNVTGWFLLPGKANERFIYNVRTIRNGGYSTRGVDVVQESDPGVCFTCICSFKKPEKTSTPSIDVRPRLDLQHEFGAVLSDKKPHEHQEMPGVDAPWYWEFSKRNGGYTDPFPGLHLQKVDMDAHNTSKPPHGLDHRNLKYYSVRGDMPSVEEDPNMHLCAHLYASDRNSLFVISNHLGIGNDYSQMGSLSHTVILHGTAEELDMIDRRTGKARWFCQEAWTGGSRQGRGTHQSRMWADDGLHIATTLQDGMVRLAMEGQEGKPGFSPEAMIRQLESRMGGKGKL